MSNEVVIVDYGMGNLKSVQRGIEQVGGTVKLSSKAEDIVLADRLLLPGVGAFEKGMRGLVEYGLSDAIRQFVTTGKPMLGICLGMQMMLDRSEEFGSHEGLGLIPGKVVQIPQQKADSTTIRKIPHIGWNAIRPTRAGSRWQGTCLDQIQEEDFFYFVHSYMVVTDRPSDTLAACDYEGQPIAAAISRENVTGLQFHTEKSGGSGLLILKRFVQS